MILIKIDKENEAVIKEAIMMGIIVVFVHIINLDIMKISLIVLIEGGAEIFIAINKNHHKVILGVTIINPLNIIMFREWIFIYKSFTKKKSAEEDIPWAIIIIIAPVSPIWLSEKILHKTNAIWATDE